MRRLIGTDIQRYADENRLKTSFGKKLSIFFLPSIMCLVTYRLSHYFFTNKHRLIARFFWTMNIILFSADITPYSDIGPFFHMPHSVGTVIAGKIGSHCTVYAQVGVGHGRKAQGVGEARGCPTIGDHVTIGAGSLVLGTIQIGSHTTIAPGSIVMRSFPESVVIHGNPARVIKKKNVGENNETDLFSINEENL